MIRTWNQQGEMHARQYYCRPEGDSDEKFHVICPRCGEWFKLTLADEPQTLFVAACESAGVYRLEVTCPHCLCSIDYCP